MSNSAKRKAEKLGMSFGAARHKLVKSILWDFIVKSKQNTCYQCNTEILTISDLSIEHKTPWETSENPVKKYFDLNNIAYSHLPCNVKRLNQPSKVSCPSLGSYRGGCRCEGCVETYRQHHRDNKKKYYTKEKRQAQYKRTGK